MCWEGWNPNWDSQEWSDRALEAAGTGKVYSQREVDQINSGTYTGESPKPSRRLTDADLYPKIT